MTNLRIGTAAALACALVALPALPVAAGATPTATAAAAETQSDTASTTSESSGSSESSESGTTGTPADPPATTPQDPPATTPEGTPSDEPPAEETPGDTPTTGEASEPATTPEGDTGDQPAEDDAEAERSGTVNGEDEAGTELRAEAVAPQAVAPVAAADTATVRAGDTVRIAVTGNDEAAGATVRLPAEPEDGTATVTGDAVDFTPSDGFKGRATFDYELVADGFPTATATVTVTVLPRAGATAMADHAVTAQNRSVRIAVLRNDTAPEGAAIAVAERPRNGLAGVGACGGEFCDPDDVVVYRPDPGFSGRDSFTYSLRVDGAVADTATVTVDVAELGEGSVVAVDDTVTVRPGRTVSFDPTDNDLGAGGADVVRVDGPEHGRLTGPDPGSGTFTYTPDASFAAGVDTFTYRLVPPVIVDVAPPVIRAVDSPVPDIPILLLAAAVADTATVTIIVDGPISGDDAATTDAGRSVDIDVAANDSGIDESCLTVPSPQPMAGTARVLESGLVRYTPASGFSGRDDFVYGWTPGCEGDGFVSPATVSVTVRAPEAEDDTATTASGELSGLPVEIDVLANDGPAASAFGLAVGAAQNGTPVVRTPFEGRPVVRYTPKPGFAGTDSFEYQLRSGTEVVATATVTVTVVKVTAADDAEFTTAGTPVTVAAGANDTLAEGVGAVIVDQGDDGAADVTDAATATIRYTPGDGLTDGDEFEYALVPVDGEGEPLEGGGELSRATVTITRVQAVPDAVTSPFRLPVEIDVRANDVGAEDLAVVPSQPDAGTIEVTEVSEGVFRIAPVAGFAGSASLTYRLVTSSDGEQRTVDTGTVTVEVPEPTVAVDDTATTDPGVAVTIDVLANDENTEGLTVQITPGPGRGTAAPVTGGSGGEVTYTPAAGRSGEDTFGYALLAPGETEPIDTGEVTVTVRAPDAVDDAVTMFPGQFERVDVRANDAFAAGFAVRPATGADAPDDGTAVLDGDGIVRYTPDRGFTGRDQFRYDLVEPDGTVAASAVVRVTVRAVDARDDSATTRKGVPVRIRVLANDVAPGGVTVQVDRDAPAGGPVNLLADGRLEYRPSPRFEGTDTFRYALTGVVRGVRVVLDTAVVTVTVPAPPVVTDPDPGGGDPGTGTDPDPGTGPGTPPVTDQLVPNPGTPTTPPPGVQVEIDVDSTSPLADVTVRGSGCAGGSEVVLDVDGRAVTTVTADEAGQFTATIPAPDGVGKHRVGATCGASTTSSSLDVVVTTMQSGTQAPAGAAAAAAILLLFFLLSGMGLNPTGRRASTRAR